ncbi:MAG TPA: tetratricopeptide repeat protein, partial [Myxococcaceae bacterium]|nr:tetratricopeptide repeat protein [Myxococcaceae bacterium]
GLVADSLSTPQPIAPPSRPAETPSEPTPVPALPPSSGDPATAPIEAPQLALGHGAPSREPAAEDAFLDALPPLGPDVFESVPRRRTGLVVAAALVGIAAAALVGFVVTRTVDAHSGGGAGAGRPVAGPGAAERGGPPPRAPETAVAASDGGGGAQDSEGVVVAADAGRSKPSVHGAGATAQKTASRGEGAGGKARASGQQDGAGRDDGGDLAGANGAGSGGGAASAKTDSGTDQKGAGAEASAAAGGDAGESAPSNLDPVAEAAIRSRGVEAEYAKLVAAGRAAIDDEKFRKAASTFRRALALKPDSADAKAGLGVALVGSDAGDSSYREAISLLNEALKQDGENARAWLALGLAYQMLGRDKQAVAPYRKYLVLEPRGRFADDVRSALSMIRE